MAQAAEMGAIIAPPVPAFYRKPETIQQLVEHSARRAIGLLGGAFRAVTADEWTGEQEARNSPHL
jgi:4-hydroxy-3-polyprenylbenzoate decarboxylase